MVNRGINRKAWDKNFNILVKYINSSEEIKKEFENTGRIHVDAFIIEDGEKVKIGRWLYEQRKIILKKYEDKTLKEIENDENIKEYDKYRLKKLLGLGVTKIKSMNSDWDEKYNKLVEYLNSSEEIKEYFNNTGRIKGNGLIEINGENVDLKMWLNTQKQTLMKEYEGMTIDEIKNSKFINPKEKSRILKLLEIGVACAKKQEKWDDVFDLLNKYLDENPEQKDYFLKTGKIYRFATINKGSKKINLGIWFNSQRVYLMKKYQSMTIEQIEKDENIPVEDKIKMKKLLSLGVAYLDVKEKSNDEQWDENYNLLKEYINKSEQSKEHFKLTGFLDRKLIDDKNVEKLNKWVATQKTKLLKKYININIEEIENNQQIPEIDKYRLKKLYEIGAFNTIKDRMDWEEKFNVLVEYINSSSEIKSDFERRGKIDGNTTIQKDGKTINIGSWLITQKTEIMKKYYGMTVEQIEQAEQIPQIEKDRMKKLLSIGVSYANIHEKSYEEEWDERFEALKKYINSSDNTRKYFKKYGRVKEKIIIDLNGKEFNLTSWLRNQKYYLIKINAGKSIDDISNIENNENISINDKRKIKLFLDLGVNLKLQDKTYLEQWNEKFDLLVECINNCKRVKEQFKIEGTIDREQIIKNDYEEIQIGMWLATQRNKLMKKYEGMTLEEIKKDKTIPKEDKYKMTKLLKLGVSYQDKEKSLKANRKWEEKFKLLEQYVSSSEEVERRFKIKRRYKTKYGYRKRWKEYKYRYLDCFTKARFNEKVSRNEYRRN